MFARIGVVMRALNRHVEREFDSSRKDTHWGQRKPKREAYEKSREFKDGQRFRAGIEGRISVLFRGRGMKRCLAEGRERFELWVAAAVLANNLMKIAALLADRSARRRKAA